MRHFTNMSAAILGAVLAMTSPAAAQLAQHSPFGEDSFQNLEPRRRNPAPPPLTFKVLAEIDLPGPIPPIPPSVNGGRLIVPLESGYASLDLPLSWDRSPLIHAEPPPEEDYEVWRFSETKERYRFRTFREGKVVAERRGNGWERRWRKRWIIRTPGSTQSPPLVHRNLVFFGSTDNRIYAVRARNGHRIWVQDVGARITCPLSLWTGTVEGSVRPVDVEMVLVVPDGGKSLLALDTFDGRVLATYAVSGFDNRLIASPIVMPDGRIAVAKQRYRPSDAGLVIIEVAAVEETASPGDEVPGREAPDESDS